MLQHGKKVIAFFMAVLWLSLFAQNMAYGQQVSVGAFDYADLQSQQVQKPNTMRMSADLLIARPLLIGATAIGSVFFVATLPFSILGGNPRGAAEQLVLKPGRAAFFRCLGCTMRG